VPRKTKTATAAEAPLPSIPKQLIDQFVTGPMSAKAVNAASMAFKKALDLVLRLAGDLRAGR
jgi:putative transposase